MKLFAIILFSLSFYIIGVAQVDTSFYPAEYPLGLSSLVADVESFAQITDEEKLKMIDNQVEVLLIINMLGDVIELKTFAEGHDSLFLKRIRDACFNLKKFTPAYYNGGPVDSYFNFQMKYESYSFDDFILPEMHLSDFEVSGRGTNVQVGVATGILTGEISKYLTTIAGLDSRIKFISNKWNYNLNLVLLVNDAKLPYKVPETILRKSNDVLFFVGAGIGRSFKWSNMTITPTINLNYSAVNVGFDEDDQLFRHEGFSPGFELEFGLPISKHQVIPYYLNYKSFQQYVQFFTGTQFLFMNNDQSDGLILTFGVRYDMQFRSLRRN